MQYLCANKFPVERRQLGCIALIYVARLTDSRLFTSYAILERQGIPLKLAEPRNPKCKKILLISLLCFFLAVYFFYTRPLAVDGLTGGNSLISASILKYEISFQPGDVPPKTTTTSIFTKSPSELEDLASFLNGFPVNRKVNWKSWIGIPDNGNFVENGGIVFLDIYLSYEKPDGTLDSVSYGINSQGKMNLEGSPCGIGRFGQRNQAFYEALLRLFAEKSHSPLWEVSS